MEVPDRLPFEIGDRLLAGGPRVPPEHHLQAPLTVMATKGSGTVRPFIRLVEVDVLLYQCLVDRLGPCIEATLLDRGSVFAYRQNLDGAENQFEGTTTWSDFAGAAQNHLEASDVAYCLRSDVSGYFLQVDPTELERLLLQSGADANAARDLADLLRGWQALGIRGLPQGIPASSPLGNFYLHPLDLAIRRAGFRHVRYMDDLYVFTSSFSDARSVQDIIERFLYPFGLTLSGEKSRIERAATALGQLRLADALIEERRELFREGAAAMLEEALYRDEDAEIDAAEIDVAAVVDLYQEVAAKLRVDDYPQGFRATLRQIYRELRAAKREDALADLPELLNRFPDMTGEGAQYAAYIAEVNPAEVTRVFDVLLSDGRFHREQELLQICRSALYLPRNDKLAGRFGTLALEHAHPLVRARALLAWGALSSPADFSVADEFWSRTHRPWRAYPFVAIQDKDTEARDDRYTRWGSAGRLLDHLAASIQENRFSWKRV
jgi:hypothetical protein